MADKDIDISLHLNIDGVQKKVEWQTTKSFRQFLEKVVNDAKEDCPVRGSHRSFHPRESKPRPRDERGRFLPTDSSNGISGGTLRNSISYKLDIRLIEGMVFTQAGYGGYVEVGTKYMPARPYIITAFQKNVRSLVDDMEGSI